MKAEGGEAGWSLDHRKPDGIKDWFSGGWTQISNKPHPEPGTNDWYSIDHALIGVVSGGDIKNVSIFTEDRAKINAKLRPPGTPLINNGFGLGEFLGKRRLVKRPNLFATCFYIDVIDCL